MLMQASIISIVCEMMCCAPAALKPVDADRRHAAVAALMDADRKVEVLGRAP
jgi:hypothetical protein